MHMPLRRQQATALHVSLANLQSCPAPSRGILCHSLICLLVKSTFPCCCWQMHPSNDRLVEIFGSSMIRDRSAADHDKKTISATSSPELRWAPSVLPKAHGTSPCSCECYPIGRRAFDYPNAGTYDTAHVCRDISISMQLTTSLMREQARALRLSCNRHRQLITGAFAISLCIWPW